MKNNKYYEELEKEGYYETIDKRSKDYREYKEYLKRKEDYSKIQKNVEDKNTTGLGDVVEKITKATGIKKVVEAITDDCGCDERKEKFNKLFTWKRRNINCISEEDYQWYVREGIAKKQKWSFEERERLVNVYNSIFNTRVKNSNCSSCVRGYQDNLNKYIEIYNS